MIVRRTMGELRPGQAFSDEGGRKLVFHSFHASHHDNVVVAHEQGTGKRYEYAACANAYVEEP